MYKKQIQQIAKTIQKLFGFIDVEKFFKERFIKFVMIKNHPASATLTLIKKDSEKYGIYVIAILSPKERLVSLMHEFFHLPFYYAGIPNVGGMPDQEACLLEDVVDCLAEKFVDENRKLVEKIFEQSFGFSVYETPVDIPSGFPKTRS